MTGKSGAAPWSVKGVERPTRETARQAAQAAGMTVGAWIEQAIRSHETLLAAAAPEAEPAAGVLAAAQRAEVRSLEAGVESAESRAGDMVIPVALKVQELAHRLVEIEQARVAGRTRAASPTPEPLAEAEASPAPPEDDFERFLQPEPEPDAARPPAPGEDFPTPMPPEENFERFRQPEPLGFNAATEIPEERPHRRAWARPRAVRPKRKSRFRRIFVGILGAVVALVLGAGSAVLFLDHGELIGLPPRLADQVADGVDRVVAEGRRLAQAGEEVAVDLIRDIRSLFEELPAESGMVSPVEPPKDGATPPPEPPPSPPVAAVVAPPASAVPSPSPSLSASASRPGSETPAVTASASATPSSSTLQTVNGTAGAAAPTPMPVPPPPPPQIGALPPTIAQPPPSPAPPREPAQSFPTLEQPKEQAPPARAADELERVARQGDVKAQYELGVLAVQPDTGQPDYGKAAYWFREAAVQGNQSAQYNLGVLYEHGFGVGQDDVRALLWYHSAAEQGHARAQYNLGVFYAQGRGIPTDYGEAQRWFKKSADQGVAKAFYNLAVLAEAGLGGPVNATAARSFMSRAALLGDPEAREALAKRPVPRPDPAKGEARPSSEVIGAVQHMLGELGYDAGRADGLLGDKTRQAIRKFQGDSGLPQTGIATEELLEVLTAKLGPALSVAAPRTRTP
ncbi:MAG: hypothetical protein FJX60_19135 [Alphaproteobacteria bacterium]|nr:hypothetical protein [Alphaproteobacteria bacterium]